MKSVKRKSIHRSVHKPKHKPSINHSSNYVDSSSSSNVSTLTHKYDIITLGSATVDVFAHTDPSQSEVLNVHHHKDIAYPLGAKILIEEMNIFTGGGGTNSAVAFSRMGFKTGYIGKIGKDDNGKTISDNLFNENVEFMGAYGNISGYSVILDSVEEDRTIFTYKGCNDQLSLNDIKLRDIDTRWIYMSSMMNTSFVTQKKIVEYAGINEIKVAYNPSLYMVKNGSGKISGILKKTHILIFNKDEAKSLVKESTDNIYTLLFQTSKLGPKIVVITDGKHGAHCYNTFDETVYSIKPKNVKVVETTGAGDAFASGFVAGIMLDKSIDVSLKMGMLNAESVIQYLGAKNNLLGHNIVNLAEHEHREIIKKKL